MFLLSNQATVCRGSGVSSLKNPDSKNLNFSSEVISLKLFDLLLVIHRPQYGYFELTRQSIFTFSQARRWGRALKGRPDGIAKDFKI